MSEPQSAINRFQWRWVVKSAFLYLVLYFLPLFLIPEGGILAGIWILAGIFFVAALSGFLSKGVTIKEPAIAALLVLILWIIVVSFRLEIPLMEILASLPLLVGSALVLVLALAGAWWGERAQKLWRKDQP